MKKLTNTRAALAALLISLSFVGTSFAIDSTSDGSDGALSFMAGAGVIDFDPVALGIDLDGDNIFHFTTIDVPAGTTVRLRANILGEGKPVIWLASGDVTIEGTVDLNGAGGHAYTDAIRFPAEAGAGGFSGGIGQDDMVSQQSGNGPGGGQAALDLVGGGGGYRNVGGTWVGTPSGAPGGTTYGNNFLLPLIGGSGGGGGDRVASANGAGGGGGGGAIQIVSGGTITVNGLIRAIGGLGGAAGTNGNRAGGGSGGAIRLMADSVIGTGELDVTGGRGSGNFTQNQGGMGRIRIEANDPVFFTTGDVTPTGTYAHPGVIFLPTSAPRVRVTAVDSVSVAMGTTGSFETADVTIDTPSDVTIDLEANNVPLGSIVQVTAKAEDGTTTVLMSTPLTGTVATSTATVGPVLIPHGFTRLTVYVSF